MATGYSRGVTIHGVDNVALFDAVNLNKYDVHKILQVRQQK